MSQTATLRQLSSFFRFEHSNVKGLHVLGAVDLAEVQTTAFQTLAVLKAVEAAVHELSEAADLDGEEHYLQATQLLEIAQGSVDWMASHLDASRWRFEQS